MNQNQVKTALCRPPPPPPPQPVTYSFDLLLNTLVANPWRRYALQKNLVAKVRVASQEILLQTYVVEWPPKPVTKTVLLIHSRVAGFAFTKS